MVWPFGSSNFGNDDNLGKRKDEHPTQRSVSWTNSLGTPEPDPFFAAKEWAPTVLFSLAGLGALQLYANYLRRIPGAAFIRPNFFRKRSIYGRVTSVGDGDGFHMFHTPGGRAVGWGWLRRIPEKRKELKDRTVIMRIPVEYERELMLWADLDSNRRHRRPRTTTLWPTYAALCRRSP
jgi:hypothetical protein